MTKQILTRRHGILMVVLVAAITMGGLSSCNSSRRLARERTAAEYAARVEQSKKDLTNILNGTSPWTLKAQMKRLETIKSYNIDNQEVKDLIKKVSEKLKIENDKAVRRAEEKRLQFEKAAKRKAEQAKFSVLNTAFKQIAEANSYDMANQEIAKTLTLFSTPEAPVLIIISQAAGFNDYDKPTTIIRFLNYLKDMKAYRYRVTSVKRGAQGKITELELINK